MKIMIIIIIIPPYFHVHQTFWTPAVRVLFEDQEISEVFSQDVSCSQQYYFLELVLPHQSTTPASFQPLLYLVCYEPDVCLNFKVPENFDFFILQQFLDIVFTIFRKWVDDISCTDSNVALKLLYYDALYNLSVQFYCMN